MEAVLKRKLGRESRDYLAITFGLICYSLGWAAFLLPYQITTGGVTGIAAIIYYATGVEIQVSYFVINAVFLGFALKILGPKFSVKNISALAVPASAGRRRRKAASVARTRPGFHGLCHWSRYAGLWYWSRVLQ